MRVYLSSSFSARDSGDESLMQLRKDLQARGDKLGVTVVLGEDDKLIQDAKAVGDEIKILERCVLLAAECDAFFGFSFERHGSVVTLDPRDVSTRARVSFFEAELLEACMRQKPCCVAQVRDVPPGPAMREFLYLVAGSLGRYLVDVDRAGIGELFDDFCRSVLKGEVKPCPWLFDPVSIQRIWRTRAEETTGPKLSFLGGALREQGGGTANRETLLAALGRVEAGRDAGGGALGYAARLSYLWIAVRELARAAPEERTEALASPLQRTLELWNSAAAWRGLHGAHPMGCLAALNDLGHARRAAAIDNPPLQPRASAYHSIGRRMQSPANARRFFGQSLALCNAGLRRPGANRIALLQQRGSAHAQLAVHGEKWRYFLALADYRSTFDAKVKQGFGDPEIGESETEYAYAVFKSPWRRKEALALMAEGMDRLRAGPQWQESGFYHRAAHKQAEMLMVVGALDEAEAVAAEAHECAKQAQSFDQAQKLSDLLAKIRALRRK